VSSKESPPNLALGLDHSEAPRMRAFYVFLVVGSLVVLLLTPALGGDTRARHLLQLGVGWLCLVNAATYWSARVSRGPRARITTVYWPIGALAFIPALYFFGPLSAVSQVFPLGVMFVALGRDRRIATTILALFVGSHLLVMLSIALGWVTDVGLVASPKIGAIRLAAVEVSILAMMVGAFVMGRRARQDRLTALAWLGDARQVIGDQNQVIAEVKDRLDHVNRAQTGRWTGHTVGRWRLGAVLGRGGMGEVYEADGARGERAAVKVLSAASEESPSLVERFHRELRIAALLDSPHVVRILDVSPESASLPYLAMERLRGTDLADRLRTEMRLPLKEVVVLLEQVARGLEVAHGAGVVHRDLNPRNLFLHGGSCWKILDFGVAKVFGLEGTLTQNAVMGTPQYMAPEQFAGEAVTHLSDIYALGVIAYRCLTGRVPHGAKDFAAILYQVMHSAPVRPGSLVKIPREVDDVLAVAMARDPRRRFQSATELVEQLTAAASGKVVRLDPPTDAWASNSEEPHA